MYRLLLGPTELPVNCRATIVTYNCFHMGNICHTKWVSNSREKRDERWLLTFEWYCTKHMRQSVQRLSPIRLVCYCCVRGFFSQIQLYSAVRMDKSLQLTNETTTESLLELGSVLGVSFNYWNEELSA